MSIEGLPPASNPFSRLEKNSEVNHKAQAQAPVQKPVQANPTAGVPAQPQVSGTDQTTGRQPVEGIMRSINTEEAKAEQTALNNDKVTRHIAELQAMTEKIKTNNRLNQTRHEIISMGNSLMELQQDLAEANTERYARNVDIEATYAQLSYWDKLDVVSKSQTINKLKDEISAVTINRDQLVQKLKEQVSAGDYQASGAAILKGMIDEYF